MKNSNKCVKCNSESIARFDYPDNGQINPIRTGMFSSATVARLLCCDCGYIEDWVMSQYDLEKIREKHSLKTKL